VIDLDANMSKTQIVILALVLFPVLLIVGIAVGRTPVEVGEAAQQWIRKHKGDEK
jgi:hypothetical protein